ncbi:hypothetical protein LSAT2_006333 [Lamellibrachia satsuma]|nr:hypothetical protein LSAT2_006333 [Lamellibrachia satsuma]
MTDALENHQGTVSIGGRTITNLRFADDIDGLAGDEQELVNLVERLEKTSTSYGMEISAEKTKLMTNNTQGISTEVKVNGQRLQTVTSFRYLGSIITDEGSKPEILARIAQTTAALTRLKPLWNDRNIMVSSKIRLMRSLVMSIFLYACETWTLSADLQKRIQTMEMRCFRKILRISYKDHVTNEAVRNKIKEAIGPYDDLLTTVKKRKLKWYGHVSRSSGLAKTILQGTVRGGRRRGRQKKRWEDSIKEWTGMEFADSQRAVENRETWRELSNAGVMLVFGFVFSGLGLLLLGPSPLFGFDLLYNELWLNVLALILLGVAVSLAVIPTFVKIISAAKKAGLDNGMALYSSTAGLWGSMYALGDFLGPTIGGWLYDSMGFAWTVTYVAIACFVMAVLLCLLCLCERTHVMSSHSTKHSVPNGLGIKNTGVTVDLHLESETTPLLFAT